MAKNREGIHALIRAELGHLPDESHDPAQGLPLQVTPFGAEEVSAVMDVLLSTWVTMGKEVKAFEAEWAAWCGTKYAVMVNSGSSANLVALAALLHTGQLKEGDEVLVPAVAWSTSLFPVSQLGLVPVLVDVDPANLCLGVDAARAAMGPKTKAAIAVHLLGQPADVEGLESLGLIVMEDACAAHGARRAGRRVGSLGKVGTFSFFFSHHITTVEGGILVTDDHDLAEAARSLRAHGWIREMDAAKEIAAENPSIDSRFLFVSAGWNLRPTEMAGAMGRVQLRRIDAWLERRRANHADWCARLSRLSGKIQVWPELAGTEHAGFAFPILLKDRSRPRAELVKHLESKRISTRPISGSNLARQPAFTRLANARISGRLEVSNQVHDFGIFVGNSHAFHKGHAELLIGALEEYFNE